MSTTSGTQSVLKVNSPHISEHSYSLGNAEKNGQKIIWTDENGRIHLAVPPRLFIVPGVAFIVGATIGIVRGGRATSLRFLAENAHRPPRTVKGWYFYNKTKNYRVLLGGMKGAAKESGKLVAISVGWVAIEEGLRVLGGPWNEVKEVGAGLGTAGLFCGVYRLPLKTAKQTVLLGGLIGAVVKVLDSAKQRLMKLKTPV
ncbi:hypothetical protein F5051DRAFT_173207, partial [Lentinula edodes]